MQNALHVERVNVRYGSTQVLRTVSLQVKPGESVGLLGHNGAGKTTTMRAIMGLTPIYNGDISVSGESLQGIKANRRARLGIGFSPEDRRMIGGMSVEDNLLLPAYAIHMRPRARLERMDYVFGLVPELKTLRKRAAGMLSGGQQKMVALGRALMVGHTLLLLDEPFQGLAPALAREYAETLAKLREKDSKLAILISETNLSLINDLVQRHYVLTRGEIVPSESAIV